jgi:hypothetical protein
MKEKLNNRYYKPKNESERNEIIGIYKANGFNPNLSGLFDFIEAFKNDGDGDYVIMDIFDWSTLNDGSRLTTIEELRELVREPATIAQTCGKLPETKAQAQAYTMQDLVRMIEKLQDQITLIMQKVTK